MEMTDMASRVETTEHRSGSLAWAESVLRDQGMPRDELGVVLSSDDAELVRRHLELHLERLEEAFAGQRGRATSALRLLTDITSPRG
jgi:hypothetical protein